MNTPASDKQVAFIKKLMAEKDVPSDQMIFITAIGSLIVTNVDQLTKANASAAIDRLMSMPAKANTHVHTHTSKTVEPGFYKVGDKVYKVQTSPNSGYNFAKVLNNHGQFEYAKGALKTISAADKLTLEDAKQYGRIHGTCIICSRTLTDETSIANGIGPICEAKYF